MPLRDEETTKSVETNIHPAGGGLFGDPVGQNNDVNNAWKILNKPLKHSKPGHFGAIAQKEFILQTAISVNNPDLIAQPMGGSLFGGFNTGGLFGAKQSANKPPEIKEVEKKPKPSVFNSKVTKTDQKPLPAAVDSPIAETKEIPKTKQTKDSSKHLAKKSKGDSLHAKQPKKAHSKKKKNVPLPEESQNEKE